MDRVIGETLQRKGLEPGWVAPGVCLVGRFGPYSCGQWILFRGPECALVESPWEKLKPEAVGRARAVIAANGWTPRYVLLSHSHLDHVAGLKALRKAFPGALLVAHRSFARSFLRREVDGWFDEATHTLSLGGEPLLLLHAPKHSPDDHLFAFRGTCISGDWIWGPYPEGRNLVTEPRIIRSLEQVAAELSARQYRIHTIFSSHANEARRNIDFLAHLGEMYSFFQGRLARRRRLPVTAG